MRRLLTTVVLVAITAAGAPAYVQVAGVADTPLYPRLAAVSPDGRNVYVPGEGSVVAYARTSSPPALTAVDIETAFELLGQARGVAVSPDGADVYDAHAGESPRNGE